MIDLNVKQICELWEENVGEKLGDLGVAMTFEI